jgi:predicted TIM-barrel fold metal-dependent hydrolase
MIIDIHTHVPQASSWPLFLAENRRNGVVVTVVSSLGTSGWPHYPTAEIVREANEQARALAATAPGHVLWFSYLNPQLPNWAEELDFCLDQGAAGIKLWVALRDSEGRSDACDAVAARAGERQIPVLIHTWNRTDANLPGEFDSAHFADLARNHPGTRFIAAHAGANWRQAKGLCGDLLNVMVDISGGYPQYGMLEELVAEFGPDRVLYGSDALGRSLPSQIAKVQFANVPESVREQVLWRNAAGLLGLDKAALVHAQAVWETLDPLSDPQPMPNLQVDHFCYCGSWPFRDDLPDTTPLQLDSLLARTGFSHAFVASSTGVFAYDTLAANSRFASACSGLERIRPLATLCPFAANWRVQIAAAVKGFAGAVVHPYFHAWRLDDEAYDGFWLELAASGLPVWINLCTEDWRLRLRGTEPHQTTPDELLAFLSRAPENRYVFQGASVPLITAALAKTKRRDMVFDISRLIDTTTALPAICRQHGADRLVLGSEFPFRDLRTVRWTTEFLCGRRMAKQERRP